MIVMIIINVIHAMIIEILMMIVLVLMDIIRQIHTKIV